MLTCLVLVLFTFYIQGVLKLKKNNSGAKGLNILIDRVVFDYVPFPVHRTTQYITRTTQLRTEKHS